MNLNWSQLTSRLAVAARPRCAPVLHSGRTRVPMFRCVDAVEQIFLLSTNFKTVGIDFFSRRIVLPQQHSVRFELYDVGGQSLAASMLGKYLFDADCIIFCYDVTNSASFESVVDWMSVVKRLRTNEKASDC